eukprot:Pgem_evm2s17906
MFEKIPQTGMRFLDDWQIRESKGIKYSEKTVDDKTTRTYRFYAEETLFRSFFSQETPLIKRLNTRSKPELYAERRMLSYIYLTVGILKILQHSIIIKQRKAKARTRKLILGVYR